MLRKTPAASLECQSDLDAEVRLNWIWSCLKYCNAIEEKKNTLKHVGFFVKYSVSDL